MSIKWCIKLSFKYSNKYVLNDTLNGNKYRIECVLNKVLNTVIITNKSVLNEVLNGNKYSIGYVLIKYQIQE